MRRAWIRRCPVPASAIGRDRGTKGSVMNTARRERLNLVVSEQAETETIERILRTRLRERREIRGARDRRQVHHAEEEKWIAPELASKGHPYDLETALKTGQVRCRLWHRSRWWVWKEATPREAIRIGSDGRSLVDSGHWELRVNKDDWHTYLGQAAAPTPSADINSIATDTATDPVEPSPPSMEQPSQRALRTAALPAPSTSQTKRAKLPAQPATYANHVAEHLDRTGEYPR